MLSVELRGDQQVIRKLEARPKAVQAALITTISALELILERHIKADLLSGQVLNVRSGNLRASVHSVFPLEVTDHSVYGHVAQSGDVKYGRIHEFGGKTPAHEIRATKAKALHFMMGGKDVFAKSVHHPGSVMPERSYMRRGLADLRERIISDMDAAVRKGIRS